MSRRALLATSGAAAAATQVVAAGGAQAAVPPAQERANLDARGARQRGITDAPPAYACWLAFDLTARSDAADVRRILRLLQDDITRATSGAGTLTDQSPEIGANPHRLTVTVAVGRAMFAAADKAALAPSWLKPLPKLKTDRLRPEWDGGDLVLQLCSDDPLVVRHIRRQFISSLRTLMTLRWEQQGFREPTEEPTWDPGRNLFGQVDGTVNPSVTGSDDGLLFAGTDAGWFAGGSAMVIRRIAMNLDLWDTLDRTSRENAIGRRLSDGAPLTGGKPTDSVDLDKLDAIGFTVIDPTAHVRRARARTLEERFLRRPYNYDDGAGSFTEGTNRPAGAADLSVGQIFVAFCADPVKQFVPVIKRLAEGDLLNLWTTSIGSGVWAVLPGFDDARPLGGPLQEG